MGTLRLLKFFNWYTSRCMWFLFCFVLHCCSFAFLEFVCCTSEKKRQNNPLIIIIIIIITAISVPPFQRRSTAGCWRGRGAGGSWRGSARTSGRTSTPAAWRCAPSGNWTTGPSPPPTAPPPTATCRRTGRGGGRTRWTWRKTGTRAGGRREGLWRWSISSDLGPELYVVVVKKGPRRVFR